MGRSVKALTFITLACVVTLAGCGNQSGYSSNDKPERTYGSDSLDTLASSGDSEGKLFDLFRPSDNPNTTIGVSKYIWTATLDVLSFLPVTTADPFTGVITTGYGTPPGGGRAYRAVVYIPDPALDARSLNLSLYTKGGAVDPATVRAVEDAILTRARQLRRAESRL